MTFDQIAAHGQDRWREELRQELRNGDYRPLPLLRVWIPKSNGGQRPLGIPCIRDRVVEMAALLVLGPIFEADLLRNQYGFRPGMDAKMAVRQAFWHVSDRGRSEVVDADLSDYFSSIPHGPLLRCVSRRVADGTLLSVIKRWLTAPVIERDKRSTRCTTEAKDRHRGRRRAPRSRPYWRTSTSVASFWPGSDSATESSSMPMSSITPTTSSSAADLEMDRQHWRQCGN
jgi:hypothetical protein